MHYSVNNKRNMRNILIALIIILVLPFNASAEGIVVRKAEVRMTDEGYQLTANFDIRLTLLVEQALMHGITLNFLSEFMLTRSRWYWFNEVAVKTEQTTKLSYSALTQQYRLKRGDIFQNFASLDDALKVLGNQSSDIIPAELFKKSSGYITGWFSVQKNYTAFARMRLDVSQLPKPLQVNALTSDEWKMDSEGYSWMLASEEMAPVTKETP